MHADVDSMMRDTTLQLLRARGRVQVWVQRVRQRLFDWRFGVDTAGWIPQRDLDVDERIRSSGSRYEATPRGAFMQVLSAIHIDFRRFTFVDIGSGKGAVLLYAAEFPFKRIIGLEWSARLNGIAETNIRRYRARSRCGDIRVVCGDAAAYPLPDEPLVLYLYSPCAEQTLSRLFANVRHSLAQCPRDVIVLSLNPDAAFHFTGEEKRASPIDADLA